MANSVEEQGFTLIELMIVVMVISILATIAIPSYRQYVLRNAEEEAKAQLLRLDLELERWRATTLVYKGFVPLAKLDNTDKPVYEYQTNAVYDSKFGKGARIIYVPLGSTATNHRYAIGLIDGGVDTLASTVPLNDEKNAVGRSWKALAIPNPSGSAADGNIFMLSSTGIKCLSKDRTVIIVNADCGTGSKNW